MPPKGKRVMIITCFYGPSSCFNFGIAENKTITNQTISIWTSKQKVSFYQAPIIVLTHHLSYLMDLGQVLLSLLCTCTSWLDSYYNYCALYCVL